MTHKLINGIYIVISVCYQARHNIYLCVFVSRWCMIPTPSTYLLRVTTAGVSGSRASKRVSLYSNVSYSIEGNSREAYTCDRSLSQFIVWIVAKMFSHFKPQIWNWFSHMALLFAQPPVFPPLLQHSHTYLMCVTFHLSDHHVVGSDAALKSEMILGLVLLRTETMKPK